VRRLVALTAWLVACDGSAPAAPSARLDRATEDAGAARDAASSVRHPGRGAADGGRETAAPLFLDGGGSDDAALDGPGVFTDAHDATVSADAAPPLTTTLALSLPMVPTFATGVVDYYVRCPSEDNAVTVTMTAAPGETIGLVQPFVTTPSVSGVVPLRVAAGEAIVAELHGADAGAVDYWVRCLPATFPSVSISLHPDAGTATAGYYFLGDIAGDVSGGAYAMAIDGHGVPVWFTRVASGGSVIDVESLVPDTVSFTRTPTSAWVANPPPFTLDDLSTGASTSVAAQGDPTDYHELRVLPNGDALVLSAPLVTGVDLTGLASFGSDEAILDCVIQEIDPAGTVDWEWTATDHFDPAKDSTYPVTETAGSTDVVDVFHCNSVDVADDGDLLVSARNMDSVFLVDGASGATLWKMGGASFTKDGAPYVAVTGDPLTAFYRQHDARLQPDGTVSMFDDQTGMAGPARAVMYALDVAAGTASVAWQRLGTTGAVPDMGSFRVLADGSRVIGWGATPYHALTEVTASGDALLDLTFTDGNWSYRALKVPASAFDLDVLRHAVAIP
jgi:hypothetical protein